MDRDDNIYRKSLHDQDLTGLAQMCANVALNTSADSKQSDMAHALRLEWLRLGLDRLLDGGKTEAEMFLKKRMTDFLAGVPSWMLTGF
jgi:hypothetical protein